jgi:hypothetical protein
MDMFGTGKAFEWSIQSTPLERSSEGRARRCEPDPIRFLRNLGVRVRGVDSYITHLNYELA